MTKHHDAKPSSHHFDTSNIIVISTKQLHPKDLQMKGYGNFITAKEQTL